VLAFLLLFFAMGGFAIIPFVGAGEVVGMLVAKLIGDLLDLDVSGGQTLFGPLHSQVQSNCLRAFPAMRVEETPQRGRGNLEVFAQALGRLQCRRILMQKTESHSDPVVGVHFFRSAQHGGQSDIKIKMRPPQCQQRRFAGKSHVPLTLAIDASQPAQSRIIRSQRKIAAGLGGQLGMSRRRPPKPRHWTARNSRSVRQPICAIRVKDEDIAPTDAHLTIAEDNARGSLKDGDINPAFVLSERNGMVPHPSHTPRKIDQLRIGRIIGLPARTSWRR